MKSQSFELNKGEKTDRNKTGSFINFYKSAAETNIITTEKSNISDLTSETNNNDIKPNVDSNKQAHKSKKKKKGLSPITVENSNNGLIIDKSKSKVLARKGNDVKNKEQVKVRSIMKNNSECNSDDAMDSSQTDASSGKRKKRNKSVSFMLDDGEEIVIKKTKSNVTLKNQKSYDSETVKSKKDKVKDIKKIKKKKHSEKENQAADINMDNVNTQHQTGPLIEKKDKILTKLKKKNQVANIETINNSEDTISDTNKQTDNTVTVNRINTEKIHEKKNKKAKKFKKEKLTESGEATENESTNNDEQTAEVKDKKRKKKKRKAKSIQTTDATDTEGEPQSKSRKKDVKSDVIVENLENLSIGDNAHTLTNLLDEMTVVDRNRKKKNKSKHKKDKKSVNSPSSNENTDLEKIEEGKEKVIWRKRKWNKDKKGEVSEDALITTVIIENLPLNIIMTYRTLLAEHFSDYGLIKRIGIAETYPTEDPKPVFTTSINFYSEVGATKALEHDNTLFQGNRIRVKRPLPPTETTLVVRSYAELTEQNLSSVLSAAGRIKSVRLLVKGKKSMATAFVEFDGPDAVDRAIKMASDAKIGAKKIHVSKFEQRTRKNKNNLTKAKNGVESDNEGNSENSND